MKTYSFGLVQATAYRALKGHTNLSLQGYGISAFDWALIGLVYESKAGIRTTQLAEALCVSKAMVSKTVKRLEDGGWLNIKKGGEDKRAVLLTIQPEARKKIPEIETVLRKEFKKVLGPVNKFDLLMYYRSSLIISDKLKKDIDKNNLV